MSGDESLVRWMVRQLIDPWTSKEFLIRVVKKLVIWAIFALVLVVVL